MKHRFLFFLYCASCIAIASCNRRSNNSEGDIASTGDPVRGDWVVEREQSEYEGLNPITTNDANAQYTYDKIFDCLYLQDWETLEYRPRLATELATMSDDHLTYTYKLRKGVLFSNGEPFGPKDIVFCFKAIKNPFLADASPLRNYFNDIKNVEAIGDSVVKFTLSKPYFMMDIQIGTTAWIESKNVMDPEGLTDKYTFEECNNISKAKNNSAMKRFAETFGDAEHKRQPKYLIGTGPYVLKEWLTNERITLERSMKYWGTTADPKWGAGYPDKLVYKIIGDVSAALTALKAGDVDIVNTITPPVKYVRELDTDKNPHIKKDAFFVGEYMYIGWNNASPFFNDKRVRQAMTYLCDRPTMIDKLLYGLARPVFGPTYFMRKEYHPTLQPYPFDPAKGAALLKAAGWEDTDGDGILDKTVKGKKIKFQFTFLLNSNNELRQQVALVMAEQLRKVGIIVEVQPIEWAVFLENLKTHKFDAYIGAWRLPSQPPDEYQIYHSSQMKSKGSNYVSYSNPSADSIMEAYRLEFDEAKRIQLMHRLQEIFYEDQGYTFLWTRKNPIGYAKRFQNVKWSPRDPGFDQRFWWVPKPSQKYAATPN